MQYVQHKAALAMLFVLASISFAVSCFHANVSAVKSKWSAMLAVVAVMLFSSVGAHAALDPAVTTLITGLTADVGLLFAAVVALWAAIRGFVAVFKLGNKFISRAGA